MQGLRILIYSQAFFPDHSGIPVYSSDFAFYCAENGYSVDVITGFPFYPHWKKRNEDKRKLFSKEIQKGISIYRGYMYVTQNPSSLQRVLHELTLTLFALMNSLRVKRPDVIVVFTTPVLLGVLAAFMNIFWKRKLIINVQDFQIEAAKSLNMLNDSIGIKIFNKLELWSYNRSHFVSSISNSMVNMLKTNKHLNSSKILFWPNWIKNIDVLNSHSQKGKFRQTFNIPKDTILIGYAGNIGKKQGLEIIIDLAERCTFTKNLLFLVVGEGSGLTFLKQYTLDKGLDNVKFLPFLNPSEYNDFLLDVNAIFISQSKVPYDIYFPSKLLGIMLAKKLMIICADSNSELFKTMENNKLALVANYGDLDILQVYVSYIINNLPLLEDYIERSEQFVSNFERDLVLAKIVRLINESVLK